MMLRDRIVAALEAAPYPLRIRELADAVYSRETNGGPQSAENVIRVIICHMRREGDDRVTTVGRHFYRLAEKEYGPRPADPRIAIIRRMRCAGLSLQEIAQQFGIHPSYASVLSRKGA